MPREKSGLKMVSRAVLLTTTADKQINDLVRTMRELEQRQVSRGEVICRAIDNYSKTRG